MGKDKILTRIRKLGLRNIDLESYDFKSSETYHLLEGFRTALEANHVRVIIPSASAKIQQLIGEIVEGKDNVYNNIEQGKIAPEQINSLEVYITRSDLGVAENGAMWIADETVPRILPFITEELVIVINEDSLVGNMHDAYDKITDHKGFGVFIAGPSKTADIEQSLVIGAHGAKSMTVIIKAK